MKNKQTLRWESFGWSDLDKWMESLKNAGDGMMNFWRFKKEIYNYRWWDSSLLHDTLRERLNFMADNWKDAQYSDSEIEEKELRELVAMLDLIRELENDCTNESDEPNEPSNEISEIYTEFGQRLFGIKDFMKKDAKGKYQVTTHSAFLKFLR
jgi:hypothetical protein